MHMMLQPIRMHLPNILISFLKSANMAPKTKAARSCLSNLKSNSSSKGGPFPRPSDDGDGPHTWNSFPRHCDIISSEVTVKDWPESDPESGDDNVFGFDGMGPGHRTEEDDSDLSDSDTESNEIGDSNEIHEDAVLLLFSETLQQAQRDAAEGNRKRWKGKKRTRYTGNSDRTKWAQAVKCRKIAADGVQPFITQFFQGQVPTLPPSPSGTENVSSGNLPEVSPNTLEIP